MTEVAEAAPHAVTHPLDNEEVAVTITLVHLPTRTTVSETDIAPCDADPTVSAVIGALGEQVRDDLLRELESH